MNGYGVTLVGAGALGRAIGTMLAASGRRVTLVARPATAPLLAETGQLRVEGKRAFTAPVRIGTAQPVGTVGVIGDPAYIPADDPVIFVTKGPQLPDAIQTVRARWRAGFASGAWVAGLQNGVVKDDLLRDAFGHRRVVGASTVLGARLSSEGTVVVTGLGHTYLGEFDATVSDRITNMRATLVGAGIPCDVTPDIRQVLWMKCCNAVGVFGVSSLTRLPGAVMMRRAPLVTAFLSLLREAAEVARAEGVSIADYPDLPIRTYLESPNAETVDSIVATVRALDPDTPQNYSSMAQDVRFRRATEVEQVFGDLASRANRHCLDTPLLRYTHQLIAGLDPSLNAE